MTRQDSLDAESLRLDLAIDRSVAPFEERTALAGRGCHRSKRSGVHGHILDDGGLGLD
jgi:hypothetical protein